MICSTTKSFKALFATLSIVVFLFGCENLSSSRITYVDENGKNMSNRRSSDELSSAPYIKINDLMYETPAFRRNLIDRKLAPISNNYILTVPVKTGVKKLNSWSAIQCKDKTTIFICGGNTNDSEASSSCWLFDCRTSTIQQGPEMHSARLEPCLTLLWDGRILVTGGWSKFGKIVSSASEIFDPVTKQFFSTGALSLPRIAHEALQIDHNSILLAGCESKPNTNLVESACKSTDILDLRLNRYRLNGKLRYARSSPIIIRNINEVIVIGGWDPDEEHTWVRAWEVLD